MKTLAVISFLAGAAASTGGHFVYRSVMAAPPEPAEMSLAKRLIAAELSDPQAAEFDGLRVAGEGEGKVVCGRVNAKFRGGGYVGFRQAVALLHDGKAFIVPPNAEPKITQSVARICEGGAPDTHYLGRIKRPPS